MEIKSARQVNAPIERVFDVFSDVKKAEERIEGITKLEILDRGDTIGVGTKWRETRVMFGKEATEVMWITSFKPNESYEVEAESHGTKYKSVYNFTPNDKGVLVEMTFEGIPVSFSAKIMRIFFFLFKGSTQKALEADMDNLRSICEQN